jgi:hypothetical protein
MKYKNLKISEYHHNLLKKHCDKNGLKIFKFIESLIKKNCSDKQNLYGED